MNRRQILWVVGLLLMTGNAAWAQRPSHYYPARPPISPYLHYSAINTTGLPNYFTYVQPINRFRSFLERTETQSRGDARIRMNEGDVAGIVDRQLRMRETTGLGAPSVPATFMEYSHYFNPPTGSRRR